MFRTAGDRQERFKRRNVWKLITDPSNAALCETSRVRECGVREYREVTVYVS